MGNLSIAPVQALVLGMLVAGLAEFREVISPSAITFGPSGISVTTSIEDHVTPFLLEDQFCVTAGLC